MPTAMTRILEHVTTMTFLGIVLSLVPLALWFAWTETILLVVVAIGVVSAAALVVLADAGSQATDETSAVASVEQRRTLADRSVAEIHRVFPLT
jgi:hypothetical protein